MPHSRAIVDIFHGSSPKPRWRMCVVFRLGLAATAMCASVLLWSAAAQAERAVPLVPVISPVQDSAIVARFQGALADGLRAIGWTVIDPSTVRGAGGGQSGCAATLCAAHVQQLLDTALAAGAEVGIEGKNYAITVRAFRGEQLQGTASGRCDICTLSEALKTLRELAHQAGVAAMNVLPTVAPEVLERNREAERAREAAPPADEVASGSVGSTAAPGSTGDAYELPPGSSAAPATEPATSTRWPLWPALTALSVGVLGLAAGVPLLVIDGKGANCRGEPRPDLANCERVYTTSGAGWVFTSVGIASLAASSALFYLYFASRSSKRAAVRSASHWSHVAVVPSSGGVALTTGGVF